MQINRRTLLKAMALLPRLSFLAGSKSAQTAEVLNKPDYYGTYNLYYRSEPVPEWTHDWSKGTHGPGRMFAYYANNPNHKNSHEITLPVFRFNEHTNTIEYYQFVPRYYRFEYPERVLSDAQTREVYFIKGEDGNLLTKQLRYTTSKLVFLEGVPIPKNHGYRCVGVISERGVESEHYEH